MALLGRHLQLQDGVHTPWNWGVRGRSRTTGVGRATLLLPPSPGEGAAVGGGGVPWRWPACFSVTAAASLRLLGGSRAAPVFSFSAGMSAGCARLPEEGRKRAGAPGSSAGCLAAPWRELGSGGQGQVRVEPPPPKGTPGSCAASAEGNRGRAGRGRAGPGGCPCAVPGRPGAVPASRSFGARRVRWGWPPVRGLHRGVAEQPFVSPGAACKCSVCARRRLQPCHPVPGFQVPAPDLCPRGRFLCRPGSFAKLEG